MTTSHERETYTLRTERLDLDRFKLGDAAFALELLNGPPFLRDGPLASYGCHGHGLLRVCLSEGGDVSRRFAVDFDG